MLKFGPIRTDLGRRSVLIQSGRGMRLLYADDEAWRDLAWLIPDETGALVRYPAETFGPLPPMTGGS